MKRAKVNLSFNAEVPSKDDYNICPKCKKGKLVLTQTFKGGFRSKQINTVFCPVCGYTKKTEIKI